MGYDPKSERASNIDAEGEQGQPFVQARHNEDGGQGA
jgi:hypothetical protein